MAKQDHLIGGADPIVFKLDVEMTESAKVIKVYVAIKVDPTDTQFRRVAEVLESKYKHAGYELKKIELLGDLIWESDK